jgi:hypothetical protein
MGFVHTGRRLAASAVMAATAASLLFGSASAVNAQLKPPAGRLFGSIQVDGQTAADGTTVVAHVADQTCGQGSFNATRGLYILDLDSSNDICAQMDATVWFTVGNCTAYNTGMVPEYSGALEVDLVAPGSC